MLEFLRELLIELACDYLDIERNLVIEVRFIPEGMSVRYNVLDGWDNRWIGEAEEVIQPYDLLGGDRL